jgi:hypothetical protein
VGNELCELPQSGVGIKTDVLAPKDIIRDQETHLIEGSLEVKIPTTWTDGKAEVGRVR